MSQSQGDLLIMIVIVDNLSVMNRVFAEMHWLFSFRVICMSFNGEMTLKGEKWRQ